jgi:hypothetical protein
LYLKANATNVNSLIGVEVVELETPPAPASNRFVALHASVNEEDEDGNDISYEGFIAAALSTKKVKSTYNTVEQRTFFHFIEMGDGMVRIQVAMNGNYLKAKGGGGDDIFQESIISGDGSWVTFEIVRGLPMMNDDEVMFRTDNNHYINITPEGGLEATATTYGPETVFKVVELEQSHSLPEGPITIRTENEDGALRYLRANESVTKVRIVDAEWRRFLSTFNLIDNGDDSIYLQTTFGDYLTAVNGGGDQVERGASAPLTNERFEVVHLPLMADNEVILRTATGNYLTRYDGWLEATATNYEDAAAFIIAQKVSEIAQKTSVALRRLTGEHASVSTTNLTANSELIGDTETLTMLVYENGDVQFQTKDGTSYLSVADDGSLTTDAKAHIFQTFQMLAGTEILADESDLDLVKFQTYDGHCLYVSSNNSIYANGNCNSSELELEMDFYIVDLGAFPTYHLVSIKSKAVGRFIKAKDGNDWPQLKVADDSNVLAGNFLSNDVSENSIFFMTTFADNTITLRTAHGNYWSVDGESVKGNADNDDSPNEQFMLSYISDGVAHIRSLATNKYLRTQATNEADYTISSKKSLQIKGEPGNNSRYKFKIDKVQEVGTPAFDLIDAEDNLVIDVSGSTENFTIAGITEVMKDVIEEKQGTWGELNSFPAPADDTYDSSTSSDPISFPSIALLDVGAIGPLVVNSPLNGAIGYDTGSALNTELGTSFPLNDDIKYFYMKGSVGGGVSLGGASIAPEKGGTVEFAFDHYSPSVFIYTDNVPLFEEAVDAIGIGISGKKNIPYEPWLEDIPTPDGSEPAFEGEIWITGTFPVPYANLPEGGGLSITGDATVSVDLDRFKNSERTVLSIPVLIPTAAITQLGTNGKLEGSIDFCDDTPGVACEFSVDLATASLILNNEKEDDPWVSFSGLSEDPNDPMKIPFIGLKLPSTGPDAHIAVNGHFSKTRQFVEVQGEYEDFGVTGVKLDGLFKISDENGGQVQFDGTATLGFQSIDVSGLINKDQQIFTGSLKQSVGGRFNFGFKKKKWKITGTIDVTIEFNNGNPSFGLDAKMKACVFGKCKSVSADVSIENDGRLKVCAKIPVINKNKCDKI